MLTRTHAVLTPKPCQDLAVAAIRDAYDRRGLRVFVFLGRLQSFRLIFLTEYILLKFLSLRMTTEEVFVDNDDLELEDIQVVSKLF